MVAPINQQTFWISSARSMEQLSEGSRSEWITAADPVALLTQGPWALAGKQRAPEKEGEASS